MKRDGLQIAFKEDNNSGIFADLSSTPKLYFRIEMRGGNINRGVFEVVSFVLLNVWL